MKNKKEKSIWSLIGLGLLGALVGVLVAIFTRKVSIEAFFISLENLFIKNAVIITIIFLIIQLGLGIYYFKKGKEKVKVDLEKEDIIDYRPLEISSNIFSAGSVVLILLYFLLISNLVNSYEIGAEFRSLNFGIIVLNTISIFFSAFMIKKIINIYKFVDPMKKGDPYSLSFDKEWVESLDEREQLEIYKSSYKSLKYIQYAILIFAIILVVASTEMRITIIPFLILLTMIVLIFIGTIKK